MKSPCIFIVDDDSATLESFKIILERESYRIYTATNGSVLKALLLKHEPNLILMDYNLGEDNGGILLKNLKKNSQTSHIPVIIISASKRFEVSVKLMGAVDFLEKPIEIPLLLSKIEEHTTRE